MAAGAKKGPPGKSQTYVAFLRAINVGGHTVSMEKLRTLCAARSLGLTKVSTFIASGNVIFDAAVKDVAALERALEAHLKKALGYEVATFIRSRSEVAAIAAHRPFKDDDAGGDSALFIVFLGEPPAAEAARRINGYRNEVDELRLHGREVYWMRRGAYRDSKLAGPLLEKTTGATATVRNVTTVRRLAAKLESENPV